MISPIQKTDRPAEMIGQMPRGKFVAKGSGGLSHEFRTGLLFLHRLAQPSRKRFLLAPGLRLLRRQQYSGPIWSGRQPVDPDLSAVLLVRPKERGRSPPVPIALFQTGFQSMAGWQRPDRPVLNHPKLDRPQTGSGRHPP